MIYIGWHVASINGVALCQRTDPLAVACAHVAATAPVDLAVLGAADSADLSCRSAGTDSPPVVERSWLGRDLAMDWSSFLD